MKHTKGSWKITKSIAPFTGLADELEISSNESEEWIALCHNEANAKLIAAAPDLLEALQLMLDVTAVTPIDAERLLEVKEASRTIIKKATL